MRTLELWFCGLVRLSWRLAMVDKPRTRPEELPTVQHDYDAARRHPDRTVLPWYGAYS
jgi:hypothetical protein